jgi:hypothetical protein
MSLALSTHPVEAVAAVAPAHQVARVAPVAAAAL